MEEEVGTFQRRQSGNAVEKAPRQIEDPAVGKAKGCGAHRLPEGGVLVRLDTLMRVRHATIAGADDAPAEQQPHELVWREVVELQARNVMLREARFDMERVWTGIHVAAAFCCSWRSVWLMMTISSGCPLFGLALD